MDYKWVILSKLGNFEKIELNIPSDRVFCGLSEYQKLFVHDEKKKVMGI